LEQDVPVTIIGFANTPVFGHGLQTLLTGALPKGLEVEAPKFRLGIAIISTLFPLAGIGLAWAIYCAQLVSAETLRRAFRPAHALLEHKYYVDDLYERLIVGVLFYRGICGAAAWL